MRLFLDTSVLLSACGSDKGASREIFRLAGGKNWWLIATPYVLQEVRRNLGKMPRDASLAWTRFSHGLTIRSDIVTFDRPAVFGPAKDRPILFGAMAWADVLLTLDMGDFAELTGGAFYNLPVLRPGDFLLRERAAGRL